MQAQVMRRRLTRSITVRMPNREKNPRPHSRPRRILYRFILVTVALGLVPAIEWGLRAAGVGYPTAYYVPASFPASPGTYVSNPRFFEPYFPRRVFVRPTYPDAVTAHKGDRVFRIFVFGESAAMGDPDSAFAFWRILQVMLQNAFPSLKIEVHNTAVASINSFCLRDIAAACAGFQPDLFVVYMGNNEVIGPFGLSSPSNFSALPLIRSLLTARRLALGQTMETLMEPWRGGSRARDEVTLETFRGVHIRGDDPRLRRVYANFERNLADMVRYGLAADADIVLCTVASNIRDWAPFSASNRSALSAEEKQAWEHAFSRGRAAEEQGNEDEAVRAYEEAKRIDDTHAELLFRLGRLYARRGNNAEAKRLLFAARDWDTLRLRADTPINESIRRVSRNRETDRVHLVDTEAVLGAAAADGLPGNEFFYEHVHFRFPGAYEVARAVFSAACQAVQRRFPTDAAEISGPPSLGDCRTALAFSRISERWNLESILHLFVSEPFRSRSDHAQILNAVRSERAALPIQDEDIDSALRLTREALEASGYDPEIANEYANLLSLVGAHAEAEKALQESLSRYPYFYPLYRALGTAQQRQGHTTQAKDCFLRVLSMLPQGDPSAEVSLGLLEYDAGNKAAAKAHYLRVLELTQRFAPALNNLGHLALEEGDYKTAEEYLLRSIRTSPGYGLAWENLSELVRKSRPLKDRITFWEERIREFPYLSTPFLCLAYVYLEENNFDTAEAVLKDAQRVDTTDERVLLELGWLYHRQQRYNEAWQAYDAALKLNPRFALVWNNMGFLAQNIGRIDEAERCYRRALALDPKMKIAEENLEAVRALRRLP